MKIRVITNSDNDFNLEHIFDAVSGYMEKKEWRFETVDIKSSLNESPVNSLYPYFDMLIANDDNWFSSISNRLKSSEEYNSEELSFDKIEPFTNKIADILSVGSDYSCPEKHFFMVEKKLNDVSAQASNEVNNLELFIINNMISVGLSSLKSWTEILEYSHKIFTKEEKEGEISSIDWEYLGDLAKADAAGEVVGCMSMYKTIVGGLVLGGPKGALAAAGYTFGKGALVGSLAYALAENIMEEN